MENDDEPVLMKPRPAGARSFRKRPAPSDLGAEDSPVAEAGASTSLQAMRTLQRNRQRACGVTLEAKGEVDPEEQAGAEPGEEEPGDVAAVLDATFTQQTEGGDVDPNMLRYIEEAMGKDPSAEGGSAADALDDEEAELYKTPEFLLARKNAAAKEDQEEDAQRWLAGIEEVEVSVHEKLYNVEQTEKAKAKMLDKLESKMRKSAVQQGRGEQTGGGAREATALPGNFGSNYHMHRKSFAMAQRPGGGGGLNKFGQEPAARK